MAWVSSTLHETMLTTDDLSARVALETLTPNTLPVFHQPLCYSQLGRMSRSEQTKTSFECPDFSPQAIWWRLSNLASRKSAASVFVILLRAHEFEFVKFPVKQSLNWSVSIASSQCFTSDWCVRTPATPHNHATKISASIRIPKTHKVNTLNMWLLYHKVLRGENKKPPQRRGFSFLKL